MRQSEEIELRYFNTFCAIYEFVIFHLINIVELQDRELLIKLKQLVLIEDFN